MSNAPEALVIAPEDNVAVVLRDFVAGELAVAGDCTVTCLANVPSGHKLAIAAIPQGASIVKCGVPVGITRRPIDMGEHVHIHNVASRYITDH